MLKIMGVTTAFPGYYFPSKFILLRQIVNFQGKTNFINAWITQKQFHEYPQKVGWTLFNGKNIWICQYKVIVVYTILELFVFKKYHMTVIVAHAMNSELYRL